MPPSDITGKISTLALGDSKKAKIARHAASSSGGALAVIILLNQFPGMVPYVIADEDYTKTRDSVVTMVEKVSTLQQSFTKQESKVETIQENIVRIAEKLGVTAQKSQGPVIIEYKPDSLRSGVIRKGDTVWIPIQDSAATRPR